MRPAVAEGPAAPSDLVRAPEELERKAIFAALARTGGDERRAAELLRI